MSTKDAPMGSKARETGPRGGTTGAEGARRHPQDTSPAASALHDAAAEPLAVIDAAARDLGGGDGSTGRCSVLEAPTRLSRSVLWELMRNYYNDAGVSAWGSGTVPFFVTSNAHIARAYARLVRGLLRDCAAAGKLVEGEPIYVVELGAGSGKFGYLLAHALHEVLGPGGGAAVPGFASPRVVVVLTDFAEANVDAWESMGGLRDLADAGRVDFATFDAGNDEELRLRRSGAVLRAGTVANPLVAVANYFFDTLPVDAFSVCGGELREVLVSAGSLRPGESKSRDAAIIGRLDNEWSHRVVPPRGGRGREGVEAAAERYFDDDGEHPWVAGHLGRCLRWYTRHFSDGDVAAPLETPRAPPPPRDGDPPAGTPSVGGNGSDTTGEGGRGGAGAADDEGARTSATSAAFNLPTAGVRAVHHLLRLSRGRILLIAGDKGHTDVRDFCGAGWPHIARHGSFSLMVNFHALGLAFASARGFALQAPWRETSISVGCFVCMEDAEALEVAGGGADAAALLPDGGGASGARALQWPWLREAYDENVASFGPNEFFLLQKSVHEDAVGRVPLAHILSLLRLSNWDPDTYWRFRDAVPELVLSASGAARAELLRGVQRMRKHAFIVERDKDMEFEIGRVFYSVGDYDAAAAAYRASLEASGPHHVTFHNIGLCEYALGRLSAACERFSQALGMSSTYEPASEWLARARDEEGMLRGDVVRSDEIRIGGARVMLDPSSLL